MFDVESVLARLPAEVCAGLTWARKPIEEGVEDLRTAPLTDELVAAVGERVLRPLLAIMLAAGKAVANLDEQRAAVMQDLQEEERRLGSFVETDDARDTLRWIAGIIRSFVVLALDTGENNPPPTMNEVELNAAIPALMPLWSGLIAVMAAATEAKRGSDAQRARELLDVAFLSLMPFRNAFRAVGAELHVFPYETTEERRHQLTHYAERLRSTFTSEDAAALDSARLRKLR